MKQLTWTEWVGVAIAVTVVAFFLLGGIVSGLFTGANETEATMNEENSQGSEINEVNATSSDASNVTSEPQGTGPSAVAGSVITVHYVGRLQDGRVFDSSVERGQPFSFVLGVGDVIQGWDQGLIGARAGEKKTLVLPPAQAYGAAVGHPLQNETLIFDVEVLGVELQ